MLSNRRIAVSGANGNLGRAIVTRALELGADVVLLDIQFGEDLAAQLPSGRVVLKQLNMFDEQATMACFQSIGQVDALCCAAGGFTMGTPVHETSEDDWSRMYDINVRTLLNGVRAAVPGMLKQGRGKIITIGAAGAVTGGGLMGPYSAAKSAVMRISESMAAELMAQGINVNCILPSVIDTPVNREAMPDADFSDWVTPEQLANVICFLASDEASGVHGALIPVGNRA